MIKVITYGTYDLLHYGHIRLLERAKALGDYLIVGITSDDYDKTRGKINNQQTLIERIEAVKATGLADEIIVEEYDGQKVEDIRRLGVDIFTLGSDWEGVYDYLNEYCKVIYLPRTEGISSSKIRAQKMGLKINIVGELCRKEKFINEAACINGIEIVDNYDEADAVYVVSHPKDHYRDVKNSLDRGKHVLCESPISLSKEESHALFKLAKEKELILMDAIKTAYSTAYMRLVLLSKSGKIGRVVSVEATCTSLDDLFLKGSFFGEPNSICAWGPIALLPVFQILGTNYLDVHRFSIFLDKEREYDGLTKISLIYENAVASILVAKAAKSEGELVIAGTNGYIYVPAPWWKTDYFELRYENPANNRRYYYQLDGDGTRYEIAAFIKAIKNKNSSVAAISNSISEEIAHLMR